MRYTTHISVTEIPEIWRNHNATRLYFWMTDICGYHDDDRDMLTASLRRMALACGLTLDAVRHAVGLLQRHGLISRDGKGWRVTKYVIDQKPTARTQAKAKGKTDTASITRLLDDRERRQRAIEDGCRAATLQQAREWLEVMEQGRTVTIGGERVRPTAEWLAWLRRGIDACEARKKAGATA